MRAAATGLAALGVRPDILMTSPLARASQTAAILAGVIKPRPTVLEEAALEPGRPPIEALRVLVSIKGEEIMLVGHAPHLCLLASLLISSGAAGAQLQLKKGGVVRIDLDDTPRPSAGSLVLLLTPRVLRRIGSTTTSG